MFKFGFNELVWGRGENVLEPSETQGPANPPTAFVCYFGRSGDSQKTDEVTLSQVFIDQDLRLIFLAFRYVSLFPRWSNAQPVAVNAAQ